VTGWERVYLELVYWVDRILTRLRLWGWND
jgi:hypothetical protein